MFDAAIKALAQMTSPEFRRVLFKAIGLALVIVVLFGIGLHRAFSWMAESGTTWAEASTGFVPHTAWSILVWVLSFAAALGILTGAVFLMPAVTAFAGSFFVDEIAGEVERKHYPAEMPGQELPLGRAQPGLAHLYQLQTSGEPTFEPEQHLRDAQMAGIGDRIFFGQRERGKHRGVGRKHRRGRPCAGLLPGDRLVLERARLARPAPHAKEVKPDRGVRIAIQPCNPGVSTVHPDAELFMELACERCLRRLARLDLAAREFPVASVDFAGRSLGQQERAVGALDDSGGDFDDHFLFACRPAQSRANW